MGAGVVQISFVEQVSKHCHFCSIVEYGDNESYRKITDIVIIIYSIKQLHLIHWLNHGNHGITKILLINKIKSNLRTVKQR